MTAPAGLGLAATLGPTHIWADPRAAGGYLVTRTTGPVRDATPEVWLPSSPDCAIGEAQLAAVSAMIRDRFATVAYVAPYVESLRRHLGTPPATVENTASSLAVTHVLVGADARPGRAPDRCPAS